MISAGIDMGAKNIKVVIVKDDKEVIARSQVLTGFDQTASAEEALNMALKKCGLSQADLDHIIGTGVGKEAAPHITTTITEVGADAKGGSFLFPTARVIVGIGAEEGRAIRCDEKGAVKDFAINEKCAAGSGTFVEAMARALEVPVEEFASLSLVSTGKIAMNAQCAVFAETEVVSLIHAKTPRQDIAKAVHDAIADRIASMVRRVGMEKDIVLIGGVARNPGFVDSFKAMLGMDVLVPEEPEYVSALGAALAHE